MRTYIASIHDEDCFRPIFSPHKSAACKSKKSIERWEISAAVLAKVVAQGPDCYGEVLHLLRRQTEFMDGVWGPIQEVIQQVFTSDILFLPHSLCGCEYHTPCRHDVLFGKAAAEEVWPEDQKFNKTSLDRASLPSLEQLQAHLAEDQMDRNGLWEQSRRFSDATKRAFSDSPRSRDEQNEEFFSPEQACPLLLQMAWDAMAHELFPQLYCWDYDWNELLAAHVEIRCRPWFGILSDYILRRERGHGSGSGSLQSGLSDGSSLRNEKIRFSFGLTRLEIEALVDGASPEIVDWWDQYLYPARSSWWDTFYGRWVQGQGATRSYRRCLCCDAVSCYNLHHKGSVRQRQELLRLTVRGSTHVPSSSRTPLLRSEARKRKFHLRKVLCSPILWPIYRFGQNWSLRNEEAYGASRDGGMQIWERENLFDVAGCYWRGLDPWLRYYADEPHLKALISNRGLGVVKRILELVDCTTSFGRSSSPGYRSSDFAGHASAVLIPAPREWSPSHYHPGRQCA